MALSRAKFGLYIFGKYDLFKQIPEIENSFKFFHKQGLEILPYEVNPTKRLVHDKGSNYQTIRSANEMYEVVRSLLHS